MKKILVSWIGRTDLRAVTEPDTIGQGPIAQALQALPFDQAVLLNNYPPEETSSFIRWLHSIKEIPTTLISVSLTSPTNFAEIYEAVSTAVSKTLDVHGKDAALTFHLSPGTPAMAAIWVLLAKTIFPATLIESSREQGVHVAEIPFEISAEFIPSMLRRRDERLEMLTAGLSPEAPEFESIVHRSIVMQRIVAKARRIAPRSVPVLIEGETGTGKEMLARAIHKASPRKDRPFVAVNCGAIPSELVEAELFGCKKGAFTGASQDRAGYFEAADGGTLFLDEIGELPLAAQVKILRVLQEKKVVRIGETREISFDARIIAATNRNLVQEVAEGRFRADLYYRLAVAVLQLPPLREREGDLSILIEAILDQVNQENAAETGYVHKKFSVSARKIMLSYLWPGNVRELLNVINRAVVWSAGAIITDEDLHEILCATPVPTLREATELTTGNGVNLPEILADLTRNYIVKALKETGGNKSKAARLLGLPNYQTLTNWLEKYGIST